MWTWQRREWLRGLFGLALGSQTLTKSTDTVVAVEPGEHIVKPVSEITGLPRKIAFGSCANQNKPQPVLTAVVHQQPDLFIYLGDNIYADTRDMNVMRAKYNLLAAKPEFQALRKNVAVLSIWDDHDYGENDSGKEYPRKEESRAQFLDFWKVPADSPRRQHAGIYGSHRFSKNGKTLQVILLDTRFFRDRLKRNPVLIPPGTGLKNDYQPDPNPEKTLLGDEQWAWLKQELQQPADVRIIASSLQFGHEYNGYESWTNLPCEHEKMLQLIQETRANGVLFLSGDVHWAEISKRDLPSSYPLYDITASGITEKWGSIEPNQYRVGEPFRENHFGQLVFDWTAESPTVTMQIIDSTGKVQREETIPLQTLTFPA